MHYIGSKIRFLYDIKKLSNAISYSGKIDRFFFIEKISHLKFSAAKPLPYYDVVGSLYCNGNDHFTYMLKNSFSLI